MEGSPCDNALAGRGFDAAPRAAKIEPLPHLFICAFIATQRSFVQPISSPADIVVFAAQVTPLTERPRYFALPYAAASL